MYTPIHTHACTYTHILSPLVLLDNWSNIAAMVGGVVGGLVVLGMVISFSIAAVALIFRKQGMC